MVSLKTFLAATLSGASLGRLLMPSTESLKSAIAARAQQQPLGIPKDMPLSYSSRKDSYNAGNFTRIQQDGSTCPSYGEGQWTGTVDVSDERRLFYWFAESRNDPSKDPVIIWMNGGPGASSLIGLFTEMGPCVLEVNATTPTPNPWAWNNNASVIFLDQPAGTGFSSVVPGGQAPTDDYDGAVDFQAFLNIFFDKVFPDKAHLPLYIAGESYGGHFAPVYTKHIMDSRKFHSKDAFWGKIGGIIHINAVQDFSAVGVGSYELLCSDYRGRDFLEPEECEQMRLATPEIERLGQICRQGDSPNVCATMILFWVENFDGIYRKRINSGERNNYNIHIPCVGEDGICEDMDHGNFTQYLIQDRIKQAIGVPKSQSFNWLDTDVANNYALSSAMARVKELAAILDAPKSTELDGLRLLVLNGNEDYIVNTPGQQWQYDNLLWSGHAEYRIQKWKDLPKDTTATGFWKGTSDGRLVFVGLDGAGHGVPGYLPEASYRVLQRWIANEWR